MENQNHEINQPTAEERPVVTEPVDDNNQKGGEPKPSYWVMGVFMAIFVVCGGISYCPWWMWIVVVLLILGTIGGFTKKLQAIFGIVILIWGTPIFSDNNSSGSHQSSQSSYSAGSLNSSGDHPQTESERRDIEADFRTLEQMQQRFENAYNRHDMDAAQRISDEALDYMHRMQQKNLTAEQRQRLQAMF